MRKEWREGRLNPVKTFYQRSMFYLLDLLTLSFIIIFLPDKLFLSFCDLSRLNGPVFNQIFSFISSRICSVLMGTLSIKYSRKSIQDDWLPLFLVFFPSLMLRFAFEGFQRFDWGNTYVSLTTLYGGLEGFRISKCCYKNGRVRLSKSPYCLLLPLSILGQQTL